MARPEPMVRAARVAVEPRGPSAITADARVVRPEDLRELSAARSVAPTG